MNNKHYLVILFLAAIIAWPTMSVAQSPNPLEQPMADFDKLISSLKLSALVGDPIQVGDTIIIPFAKINFGLGAGGAMTAFGGGMGGKTIPLGVLIIEGENIRVELIPQEEKKSSFLVEMLPTIMKMLPQIMGEKMSPAPKPKSGEIKTGEKATTPQANASLDEVKKLFKEQKYAEALEMIDSLLVQNPDNAELHTWKGHIMGSLSQSGNPLDMMRYGMGAMQEYEAALAIDPNNAGAHFGRGVGRLAAPPGFGGDLDGAIQDLEFACGKDPSTQAWYQLGEAYKRKGLTDKAKGAYKKALQLDPKNEAAAKALAELK